MAAVGSGIGQPGAEAIRKTALETRPAGTIPIWFTNATSSAIGAAWANAAAGSELDLDDGNSIARGHPGAAVIPAAFAVANESGASVDELLNAIVIGYEVGSAIGKARTAYGSTGTWAACAVVATAGALRRTSREVLENALAVAVESAPSQALASAPTPRIPHPEANHVKEGITWSVVTGLEALSTAQNGFRGPLNVLDAPRHYSFPADFSLGSYQYIRSTYFKPYSCCRHLHAPLDALGTLIARHGIEAENIEKIEVENTSMSLRISNMPEPRDIMDVQYSHQYCLALLAYYGLDGLLPLTAEVLNDPKVTALSRKIALSANPDFDALYLTTARRPARVTVICRERRFVSDVTEARGEGATWQELEQKFRGATRLVASDVQQTNVLSAVNKLRCGDMTALTACLARESFSTES